MSKTALYRHFDADGALLYVGISLDALRRIQQHGSQSAWFPYVQRVEIAWFDSRNEALKAERMAVESENPRHNILLRPRQSRTSPDACYIIEESETMLFDGIYTGRKLCDFYVGDMVAYWNWCRPQFKHTAIECPRGFHIPDDKFLGRFAK
jgi:predicted GIY-YIG superfamily endonuclease